MKASIFSFSIILLSFIIFVYSEINAARPLTTDDAQTVEPEAFEIEIGYDFFKNKDNIQDHSLGISLKHGLSERLDFGIAFPYEIKPEKGLGSAEVGIKFSFLKEKHNLPAVSSTFAFVVGESEYTLNGIMTKEFVPLIIHVNVGYIASGIAGEAGIFTYSGAVEYSIVKRIILVTEIVGENDTVEDSLEGLVGASFQVIEGIIFDFAIGKRINKTSSKWKITLGLTCEF